MIIINHQNLLYDNEETMLTEYQCVFHLYYWDLGGLEHSSSWDS